MLSNYLEHTLSEGAAWQMEHRRGRLRGSGAAESLTPQAHAPAARAHD